MKTITQNTPTWQQQAKIFFDKHYSWILLIAGLLSFILVERGEFLIDVSKGWNDGCKDCSDSISTQSPFSFIIPLFFISDATTLTALSFLLIITYGLVKNYVTNTKTQAQLIAQKSQAELMALKAQINPHFLFNVLNNLYGSAIVEDSPKTSEGILQLSSIMRHVVEGTKNERIEVEKEVRFLNDYIELNKMRIPNRPNIRIITEIFWDENPTMIAPLLVIPYIENAFKYGISTTEECFIEMNFRVENQQLSFSCKIVLSKPMINWR